MTLSRILLGGAFALVGAMNCQHAMAADDLEDDLGVDVACEGLQTIGNFSVTCRMEWSWILAALSVRATARLDMETTCGTNSLPLGHTTDAKQTGSIELSVHSATLRFLLEEGNNRCVFYGRGVVTRYIVDAFGVLMTLSSYAEDRVVYFITMIDDELWLTRRSNDPT